MPKPLAELGKQGKIIIDVTSFEFLFARLFLNKF